MAHCMESSVRAAFTGVPAWWDVAGAHVVNARLPLPEFLAAARMRYTIEKVAASAPAVVVGDDGIARMVAGESVTVPNQYHLARLGIDGDGKIVSPHTVTARYHAVSPMEFAAVAAGVVDAGFGTYDAAFTLRDGTTEIVTVRLDDISDPTLDSVSPGTTYLIVRNRHGGLGTVDGIVSRVRTVCANTERLAFANGSNFKIPHTASVSDRLKVAADLWTEARAAVRLHGERLARLAAARCNVPDTVDALLGIKRGGDRVPTRTENRAAAIVAAASNSPGTDGTTLLDVYNAVTFLGTHDKGGKGGDDDSARVAGVIDDGTRAAFADAALGKLLAIAGS